MYEGVDYTIDLRQPEGSRVTELRFNGQPVQATDTLEVVINQYRAVGGGNYAMFTPEKIQREVQIDMTELIADYLRRHPVIQATVKFYPKKINHSGLKCGWLLQKNKRISGKKKKENGCFVFKAKC